MRSGWIGRGLIGRGLIGQGLIVGLVCLWGGCVVTQPPGKGRTLHQVEPTTKTEYWMYLPDGYPDGDTGGSTGKKWPLVMSFHGLNPYDTAPAHARQWEDDADRYGFIVVAPKLRTCNPIMEYPVMKINGDVARDEEGVMKIMDEVLRRTDADPNKVLSTSWSAGGYFAHFIVNRHPERFSCVSVYQSNFSAAILDPRTTPRYRDFPIGIFYTENDFNACRKESEAAIEWYRRHGFRNVTAGRFKGRGHERTPETAARVFAKAIGAVPKTPPRGLDRLALMEDLSPVGIRGRRTALANGRTGLPRTAPPPASRNLLYPPSTTPSQRSRPKSVTVKSPPSRKPITRKPASRTLKTADARRTVPPPRKTQARKTQVATIRPEKSSAQSKKSSAKKSSARTRASSSPRRSSKGTTHKVAPRTPGRRHEPVTLSSLPRPSVPIRSTAPAVSTRRTPRRRPAPLPDVKTTRSSANVSVRLSTSIGISPLLVSFVVEMPDRLKSGADFLWTDNLSPVCNGARGQKVLIEPGRHRIEVLIITKDNQELRASSDVTVFERLTKKTASAAR